MLPYKHPENHTDIYLLEIRPLSKSILTNDDSKNLQFEMYSLSGVVCMA